MFRGEQVYSHGTPPPLPTPSWERLRELSTFVFRGETDIFGKWKMILEGTNRHGYHSPHN